MFATSATRSGLLLATVIAVALPGMPTTARAATAGTCYLQGQADITPGLTVLPQPESFSFGGSALCAGLVGGAPTVAGSFVFSGTGTCALGSLETCLPAASVSFTAGPISCTSGSLAQVGMILIVACAGKDTTDGSPAVVTAQVVLVPPASTSALSLTQVPFSGAAEVL